MKTLLPPPPPDLKTVARIAKQARRIAIVALILALLLCGAYISTTAIIFNRSDATNAQVLQNYNALSAQILEAIMSGSLNVTIVQTGTFLWSMEGSNLATRCNYTLESALLGSAIDFTILVMNPPIQNPTIVGSTAQFRMLDFTPPVLPYLPLPPFSAGGSVPIPLTPNNVNQFVGISPSSCDSSDSSCLLQVGDPADGYLVTRNTILAFGDLTPSNFFFQGSLVHFATLPFSLSGPIQLIMV